MSAVLQPDYDAAAPDDGAQLVDAQASVVLVTGLPGAGKTLWTLATFAVGKDLVFQRGIPGCRLPEFDPLKWRELKPGSTGIVDEAREVYPPKPPTAEAPLHYQLHKVRHYGIAMVIVAQHPNDIDARVRRLVTRHVHLVEVFGLPESQVHEWNRVGDVDAKEKDSVSTRWKHPKAVYALYKSSALHRKTPHVPWRLRMVKYLWLGVALCILGGPAWLYWHFVGGGKSAQPSGPGVVSPRVMAGRTSGGQGGNAAQLATPAEYIASFAPRVDGLPYTAPRYDDITKPKAAPRPAACVSMGARCSCYSQQATLLEVPESLCRQIVARGFFNDWDDPENSSLKTDGGEPGAPSVRVGGPQARMPVDAEPVHQASVGPTRYGWDSREVREALPFTPRR